MANVRVGCDPEIFVVHKRSKKVVPAYGLLPGTKDEPEKVEDVYVSVDGVAAEFGIEPTNDEKTFVGRVAKGINTIKKFLGRSYELKFSSSQKISSDIIDKLPPEVLEVGCAPDFDAYSGIAFPLGNVKYPKNFFFCGGHLHIGWTANLDTTDEDVLDDARAAAIAFDQWVGAPLKHMDPAPMRTRVYGSPGRFRAKPYGIEYRTPSNSWLKTKESVSYVFKASQYVMSLLMKDKVKELNPEIPHEDFTSVKKKERPRDIIKNNNAFGSGLLYQKYSKLLKV